MVKLTKCIQYMYTKESNMMYMALCKTNFNMKWKQKIKYF